MVRKNWAMAIDIITRHTHTSQCAALSAHPSADCIIRDTLESAIAVLCVLELGFGSLSSYPPAHSSKSYLSAVAADASPSSPCPSVHKTTETESQTHKE